VAGRRRPCVGGNDRPAVAERGRRATLSIGVCGSRAWEKRLAGAGGQGGCGIAGVGDGPPVEVILRAAAASALVDGPLVEVVPPRPVLRWRAGDGGLA
jgi:hypothetical protein